MRFPLENREKSLNLWGQPAGIAPGRRKRLPTLIYKDLIMRKLVAVLACLAIAVAGYAQSIVGNWVQEEKRSENGMAINVVETFTISENRQFEEAVVMEIVMTDAKTSKTGTEGTSKAADSGAAKSTGGSKDAQMKVSIKISCGGTWTFVDGMLTQALDPKSIRTEILEQPDGFPTFLLNMLGKTVASEFKKQAKKPQQSKVLTLTEDRLELQDADQKETEIQKYVRKP